MDSLKEKLFKGIITDDLTEEEKRLIESYSNKLIESLQPVYDYIDVLKKDPEKINDVISIIDLIKKGKTNDN